MKVALKWKGDSLMFGPFALASVREATRFTGNHASYTPAGGVATHVYGGGTMNETNRDVRAFAEEAVISGLRECGIEAEVSHD